MKKIIFISIVLCFFFLEKVEAQKVQEYTFESAIGTYSEITGGTVVWQSADDEDVEVLRQLVFYGDMEKSHLKVVDVSGIPIGFEFTYNGVKMNRFAIGSHGHIYVGKDKISANPEVSSTLLVCDVGEDSPFWDAGRIDLFGSSVSAANGDVYGIEDTEISYLLIGDAPERILVVQFKKIKVALDNGKQTFDDYDQQIRIYEGSNKIEISYNNWEFTATGNNAYRLVRVGLKGSSTNDASPEEVEAHLRAAPSPNPGDAFENTLQSTNGTLRWNAANPIPDGLTYTFTPPYIPVCPEPTNLLADGITETQAMLSWEADDENLSWDLRYRNGNGEEDEWDYVNDWEEKSYLLENLTANTAYLWSVSAHCDADRVSEWAESDFNTTVSGLELVNNDKLNVFASNRIINILNTEGAFIERVQLYDASGSLLKDFTVKTTDNILIPASINQSVAIVKVYGKNNSSQFKVAIR